MCSINIIQQWLIDNQVWVTLVGFVVTFVALFIGLLQIWWIKKEQLLKKRRKIFSMICGLSTDKLVGYEKIYPKLLNYYREKLVVSEKHFIIDKQYFTKTLVFIQPTKNDADKSYSFPLIVPNIEWLKSKNAALQIKKRPDVRCSKPKETTNILKKPAEDLLSKFCIDWYPSFLSSFGKILGDDITYDLCGIDKEKKELVFQLGSYLNYAIYYDLIAREIYFRLYCEQKKPFPHLDKIVPSELPLRLTIKDLFEFNNRPVKIGLNTFVIMKKDNDKYYTFLQQRGSSLLEYPNVFHVAPAGTFQPSGYFREEQTNLCDQEFNFEFTVLREFLEEICGIKEAVEHKEISPYAIFTKKIGENGFSPGAWMLGYEQSTKNENLTKEDLEKLGENLKNNPSQFVGNNAYQKIKDKWEIIPTGFFIDLVTLKPELTFVMWVKDECLYNELEKFRWGNWEGAIKDYEIDSNEFSTFLKEKLNIKFFLPSGAVAVAEGLNYYYNYVMEKSQK